MKQHLLHRLGFTANKVLAITVVYLTYLHAGTAGSKPQQVSEPSQELHDAKFLRAQALVDYNAILATTPPNLEDSLNTREAIIRVLGVLVKITQKAGDFYKYSHVLHLEPT